MPRLIVFAGSVLAGILPLSALALGLGEINLKSALNQPFLAEIPVVTSATEDPAQVRVSLAPAGTFERYGLERPLFLGDFEFRMVPAAGGSAIRISSAAPVVEPFVTMLIEVSWPQGRLLREYTVLLDPPVFDAPAAPVAATPPARPAAAPGRPVSRPAPAATPAPAAAAPATAAGDSYGPVQANDTLWNIAQQVQPAGVNTNQMMLAIYRANPQAFAGNINRLRAGAILRIPDAEAAGELGRQEAFAEVRRQNEAWRQGVPAAATAAPRLRLVPPPAETEQGAGSGAGTGAAAAGGASVADLEAELAERERLLAVKDQELAELQEQLASLRDELNAEAPVMPAPGAEPAAAPAAGTEAAPPEEAPAAGPEAEAEAEAGSEPAAAAPAAPAPARPAPAPRREEPSFFGALFGSIWLYVGIGVALLAALFLVGRRRRAEEVTGRWESLADADEDLDEESREATERLRAPVNQAEDTFVVEEVRSEPTDALERSGGTLEIDRSGDRELPLERTISSDAGLNLDQSDPIAEAEFHMAYGLYDQAADLLVNALQAEPGRRDLRRKLLDVYFVWENKGAFLREAQTFRDQVEDTDPEWNKVLIMGKQLCPDEDLFAGAAAASAGGGDMDLDLFEGGGDSVDLNLGDEQGDGDGGLDLDLSAIRQMPDGDALDFDIGEAEADEDFSPTQREPGSESPTVETPTIEAAGPASPTVETPTLETPMAEPTMETPTIETPAGGWDSEGQGGDQTAALDLDELGLDLSGFDLEAGDEEPPAASDTPPAADLADEDATLLAADLDDETLLRKVGQGLDSTAEVETLGGDLPGEEGLEDLLDVESTAEMRAMDEAAGEPDLEAFSTALEKSAGEGGDTLEQPKPEVDETAEQPAPRGSEDAGEDIFAAAGDDADLGAPLDLEIGEELADEDSPTGALSTTSRRPEGPTMTEVGTKLDLARAYIDMGDPEGARSILGEVIEEGDSSQRQEAQKLLEDLAD